MNLLGCTIDEFKKEIEDQMDKNMTWDNYGLGENKWHIDHIIPCDAFDLTKEAEQYICFHHTNMQPLWGEENIRKSNKLDIIKKQELIEKLSPEIKLKLDKLKQEQDEIKKNKEQEIQIKEQNKIIKEQNKKEKKKLFLVAVP